MATVERATVSRPLPSAAARNRYGIGRGGPVTVSTTVSIVATRPPSGLICVTSTAPPLLASGPASLRPAPSSTYARLPSDAPSRDPLGVADSHP